MEYDWPGNVRELKHLIERIVILEDSPEINPENLPGFLKRHSQAPAVFPDRVTTLLEMEKHHIDSILKKTRSNRSQAADLLGINRKTLLEKIKKYELDH